MKCVTRAEWKIALRSCQMRNHSHQKEKIPKGTDVSNSKIHLRRKKKKSVEVPKKPMKFVERHLNKNIHMITDCSRSEKRWIASNQNRSIYKMGIIKPLRTGVVFCLRETCFSWLTRHLYFPLESADFRMVVLVAEIHTLHRSSILPR